MYCFKDPLVFLNQIFIFELRILFFFYREHVIIVNDLINKYIRIVNPPILIHLEFISIIIKHEQVINN